MNEYNHHRIIERFALNCGLDPSIKRIFIEASDFTDSISAKSDYFFYRNYYSIKAGTHIIRLNRVSRNGYVFSNKSKQNINNSGEKLLNGTYSLGDVWSHWTDEKEFFSAVNGRNKSAHFDELDTGNQSDNVAFLHAMGAVGEGDEGISRSIFKDHLKTCFAEYLFLEKEEDALFMLGIAFHGIMDSFTPSHMGFQKYTEQDMGLHAQGDVIPIMGEFKDEKISKGNFSELEPIQFDPGQYSKEGIGTQFFIRSYKYFDGDGILNPVEYKMLRIFFYISDIEVKYDKDWGGVGDVEEFCKTFRGCKLKQINNILSCGNYRYGPRSYAYSEAAIKVISETYKFLCQEKEKLCKNYSNYKDNKNIIVEAALNYWKSVYDGEEIVYMVAGKKEKHSIQTIRKEHTKLSLYDKDPELEQWKEQQAQEGIDKLNRLKG